MNQHVAALLGLEQQLRKAGSLAQLFYTIVNQTHQCVAYTQSVLVLGEENGRQRVVAVSDIPAVDYTSPFVAWAERLSRHLSAQKGSGQPSVLTPGEVPETLRHDWQDMAPGQLLRVPLYAAAQDGRMLGVLLLFRAEPWPEQERGVMEHLAGTMGHALFALQRRSPFNTLLQRLRQRRAWWLLGLLLLAVMWLPVRLSALAPVEVTAREPLVISAPLNGAVKQLEVDPNQQVQTGDPLLSFEDTELANEHEIAQQALLLARAELKTAQQSGFMDPTQKARLAELESRVRLRQAERDYARSRLDKATVTAPGAGIAVLGDPNEWKGRPVNIGERIMLLADPDAVEFEVMLGVKDSIALTPGAEVRVFLDSAPLSSLSASLHLADYEPQRTPDNQMAYRLVARLVDGQGLSKLPRIGTRGTAKVYGERVSLFFYLFRRPITGFRQWLGW
ncbi:efflux RND transporter periplasmic adaptor subunit [Oceanimonas marisflavi]|uniref:efflux RND transporter periplasmic adaptor subunit n=1 Tax=Oceanimonas marisflavi TaxID=2059724 RepID=UPI001E5E3FAF|nr:efflux RND transporter periplasmic adaptor subunit [Oceanimonas marisflavi]